MYQEDGILWNNPALNPNRPSVNMSYALGLAQGTILKIFENEFPEDHFECISLDPHTKIDTRCSSSIVRVTKTKRLFRKTRKKRENIIDINVTRSHLEAIEMNPLRP